MSKDAKTFEYPSEARLLSATRHRLTVEETEEELISARPGSPSVRLLSRRSPQASPARSPVLSPMPSPSRQMSAMEFLRSDPRLPTAGRPGSNHRQTARQSPGISRGRSSSPPSLAEMVARSSESNKGINICIISPARGGDPRHIGQTIWTAFGSGDISPRRCSLPTLQPPARLSPSLMPNPYQASHLEETPDSMRHPLRRPLSAKSSPRHQVGGENTPSQAVIAGRGQRSSTVPRSRHPQASYPTAFNLDPQLDTSPPSRGLSPNSLAHAGGRPVSREDAEGTLTFLEALQMTDSRSASPIIRQPPDAAANSVPLSINTYSVLPPIQADTEQEKAVEQSAAVDEQ